MKHLLFIALALSALSAVSGCSTQKFAMHQVDTSISSKSQGERVQFLILHYTVGNMEGSLKELSQGKVSSHYLVGEDMPTKVYRLVNEDKAAFHAGVSQWKDYSRLNLNSIGIEIVNAGYVETATRRGYTPFPEGQIEAVLTIIKDVVARYQIKPEFILGHGEIAPQRKPDPGPLFPWKKLAEAGLITWPDAAQVASQQAIFEQQLPDITWFQQKLALHGYATPQTGVFDEATKNVLAIFQTRYRPSLYDGSADAESAAILSVLTAGKDDKKP